MSSFGQKMSQQAQLIAVAAANSEIEKGNQEL
jgi:hypothetical protein